MWIALSIAYSVGLAVGLLWPFEFDFSLLLSLMKGNAVYWNQESNGVEFQGNGQILSPQPPEELRMRLMSGAGLSVEAWVLTDDLSQEGPARIVSYSFDPGHRNFTLGQTKTNLAIRLRTSQTDSNGTEFETLVGHVFKAQQPTHVVLTYDFFEQNAYVNGALRHRKAFSCDRFRSWDPSCLLVCGNEVSGNRPWRGKLFLVAIYDRALTLDETERNYQSGWSLNRDSGGGLGRVTNGLIALYPFDEGQGSVIKDHSQALRLPLRIPNRVGMSAYLRRSCGSYGRSLDCLRDILLNVVAFIPLGLFWHVAAKSRFGTLRSAAVIVLFGLLSSVAVETLQFLGRSVTYTRFSSMTDVFCNTAGMILGTILSGYWPVSSRVNQTNLQYRSSETD